MAGILCVIPARAGSKGISRKNIRPLGGKPLLYWTIDAAIESKHRPRVLVSTEDREIADLSIRREAEVPFLRPVELAKDDTPTFPVVKHILSELAARENYAPEYVLLLQPTSPFRIAQDIDGALDLAFNRNSSSVVSVCHASQHPYVVKTIDNEGVLHSFVESKKSIGRRQDLPPAYVLNGAIYLIKTHVLLESELFVPPRALAYLMPQERSLDIDSPWDLHMAELIVSAEKPYAGN